MKRNHDIITIEVEKRMTRESSIAVYAGRDDTRGREIWAWLPLSLIEDHGDGSISLPEWLATEKGLV